MEEEVKQPRRRGGSMFGGFLLGGLIGATVALLTAPQAGEQTRTQLRDRSIELKDQAVEKASQTRDQAEQALRSARTKVNEVSRDVRIKAADLMHKEARMLENSIQEDPAPLGEGDVLANI